MKKKILLGALALVLAISLVAIGCPAPTPTPTPTPTGEYPPAGTYHWRWFDPHASRELWPMSIHIDFAKEVKEATEGALTIDWLTVGEHPFRHDEMHLALKMGYADMVSWETTYQAGDQPLFFLSIMGGVMPADLGKATEMAIRTIDEVYGWQWEEWGAGQQILHYTYPPCVFHHKTTHLTSFDVFKGTMIRVSNPFSIDFVKMFGAVPIMMAFGEVTSALITGTVDGLVTETLSALTGGMMDVTKYTTIINDHQTMCAVAISKDSWDELDDATKKTVLELSDKYIGITLASLIETSESAEVKAVEEYGVSIMQWDELSEDFRQEIMRRTKEEVYPLWIEKSGSAAEAVVAQLMQIKEEVLAGS